MDRSDDAARSRRFSAQTLGNGQTRPRIVTSRDERVAPRPGAAADKAQQPSLEFRARQRLRTYAEASTILNRQVPADAAQARANSRVESAAMPPSVPVPSPASTLVPTALEAKNAAATAAPTGPDTGYVDVIPEPPSPLAEVYVGGNPQLTEREAQEYHLDSTLRPAADQAEAAVFDEPNFVRATQNEDHSSPLEPAFADEEAEAFRAPAPPGFDEAQHAAAPAAIRASDEDAEEPFDVASTSRVTSTSDDLQWSEDRPFQTPRLSQLSQARASLNRKGKGLTTALAKSSNLVNNYASHSVDGAASLGGKLLGFGQTLRNRAADMIDNLPSLPGVAAPANKEAIASVSQLPANSLLTPMAGRLAPSARADAVNARPDSNVRPVSSDGTLDQDPGPKRALQARKIKNNVEQTETRAASPVGPIGQSRRTPMALSTLLVLLCLLGFIALAVWFTISVQQRTSQPVTAIGETERYRAEAILDALFISPGPVDGVIDDRTAAAIGIYASEYNFSGEAVLSTELLQHLETEAEVMGILDLIK
ncbi:MAG: hypothetical protein EVA88_00465 [Rhodospirillaceae bacterium]|nr:MAG: hypothetical protein EVA88_00465 [Rhodospirillaceae bacterium]